MTKQMLITIRPSSLTRNCANMVAALSFHLRQPSLVQVNVPDVAVVRCNFIQEQTGLRRREVLFRLQMMVS